MEGQEELGGDKSRGRVHGRGGRTYRNGKREVGGPTCLLLRTTPFVYTEFVDLAQSVIFTTVLKKGDFIISSPNTE